MNRTLCALILLTVAASTAVAETIHNPAEPAEGVRAIELQELWRIGEDDSDLLLGLPTGIGWDDAGRIYVLDAQLDQVHVLSPDGELLDTRYRSGEGPGELQNPSDLVVFPDGSTGVLQEYPGMLVRLDAAGQPLPLLKVGGTQETGGNSLLMFGKARNDLLVMSGMTRYTGEDDKPYNRHFTASFGPDGKEIVCYVATEEERVPRQGPPAEKDLIKPTVVAWDVAPDSRVAVALSWEKYEILVSTGGKKPSLVIEREYEPWRRSAEDKKRLIEMYGGEESGAAAIEFAEHEPTIALFQRGIQFDDEGRLIVLTSRGNHGLPPGVLARYDIFDRSGRFTQQWEVRCEGNPLNDRLLFLPGGKVLRIRRYVEALVTSLGPGGLPGGDQEPPAVICYRIVD